MNKNVTSIRKTGQKAYENIYNFIESPNNDGECPYNHATYSSSLVRKLINLYAPTDALIYDPFMGSGTTAIACIKEKRDYIGSEISSNQCKFALNRINIEMMYPSMF
jgi:DNA modification methylase